MKYQFEHVLLEDTDLASLGTDEIASGLKQSNRRIVSGQARRRQSQCRLHWQVGLLKRQLVESLIDRYEQPLLKTVKHQFELVWLGM